MEGVLLECCSLPSVHSIPTSIHIEEERRSYSTKIHGATTHLTLDPARASLSFKKASISWPAVNSLTSVVYFISTSIYFLLHVRCKIRYLPCLNAKISFLPAFQVLHYISRLFPVLLLLVLSTYPHSLICTQDDQIKAINGREEVL